MSHCGYFDDERREYVIETPKTPVRWINYIGTRSFGGFVDQVGSGVICKDDPGLNRIVKYLPQRPQSDFNGETVYLRERGGGSCSPSASATDPTGTAGIAAAGEACANIGGETVADTEKPSGGELRGSSNKLFSPFFVPTLDKPEKWECRVGLGRSDWDVLSDGIRVCVTVFVPPGADYVVRRYVVTNESDRPRELEIIPVVEFSHFEALKQFVNADWVPQTMQASSLRRSDGSLVGVRQAAFMQKGRAENWFAAVGAPVSSFETDRERFLGDYGFGGWRNPGALNGESAAELSNTEALRGNVIAALMVKLGVLERGASKTVTTLLGQSPDAAAMVDRLDELGGSDAVEAGLMELAAAWEDSLDRFRAETPSAEMNSLVNIHNARQCRITANWSRYLSLYQLGLGARGMGFRDSSQDAMSIFHAAPQEGKALLRMLLSVQKRDGSAMHQFYPLSMEANEGDSREDPERPDFYGDDHLWVVLAVCAYLRESGDYAFLDETIAFYDKKRDGDPVETAPVREHLRRALAFTHDHTGSHGLPLLGFADWNDTMNLPTGAESMMVANLYGAALREVESLLSFLTPKGDSEVTDGAVFVQTAADVDWLAWVREAWVEMAAVFRREAWDGAWWRRYYDSEGRPVGSVENEAGKIWLNAQSWPVISGFAVGSQAEQALESAFDKLNTQHGIKLSWPGYNGFDEKIGGASTYPPGAKENGGIFLHANPWAIIAETLLGRGERAWRYYEQINPASRNDCIDEFEVEPYCYPQNILGDEHPQHGLGRNSWLSGTASWCWQAATQYILGIRPDYGGLTVNPCIPPSWKGFRVSRTFRGAVYDITVENPKGVSKGVASLTVDGREIEGMMIPPAEAGRTVEVRVILG